MRKWKAGVVCAAALVMPVVVAAQGAAYSLRPVRMVIPEFSNYFRGDVAKWAKVVKATKLSSE